MYNNLMQFSIYFSFFCTLYSLQKIVSAERRAMCVIEVNSGISPIEGVIELRQKNGRSEISSTSGNGGRTMLHIDLKGFNMTTDITLHGFHVHDGTSIGNNCNDALGHFNPIGMTHGAPTDSVRHVGDLGNIAVSPDGTVKTTITDNLISLKTDHPYSILNRAIVVHAQVDDLGRGNYSDSKTTGHAGARLGCCVIRLPKAKRGMANLSANPITGGFNDVKSGAYVKRKNENKEAKRRRTKPHEIPFNKRLQNQKRSKSSRIFNKERSNNK